LDRKFKTFFIRSANDINENAIVQDFNIHTKQVEEKSLFSTNQNSEKIIITSGASCPDSIVDGVIQKILEIKKSSANIQHVVEQFATNSAN
jgi:4-hydroxy-3-methylbut-2-enyl diphosphate reductase